MRKHTVKKPPNDLKNAEKQAKNDVNQNGVPSDATSPKDTSELSESTVQALQDALYYKRLNTKLDHQENSSESLPSVLQNIESNGNEIDRNIIYNENDPLEVKRSLFQGISLKDFERHQQMLKEANLEKQKLLSQAIEQRYV